MRAANLLHMQENLLKYRVNEKDGRVPKVRKWIWLGSVVAPPCLAAEEEDKSERQGLRVVGRNVGKKGQFSYWCPWAAEEEQTQPDA